MKFTAAELEDLADRTGGAFAVDGVPAAEDFTRRLALGHYENFPVASFLLPAAQRRHVFNIYAFARIADDIADEPNGLSTEQRLFMLDNFRRLLHEEETGANPVFTALRRTRDELDIPTAPFDRLLDAFRSDVRFRTPANMTELLGYCHNSADPIGELVLRVFGLWHPVRAEYSDMICSALQLANFWQDFSRDLPRGRCYIPADILKQFNLVPEQLRRARRKRDLPDAFGDCVAHLIVDTRARLERGASLLDMTPHMRLRMELAAIVNGGRAILSMAERLGADIIEFRPNLRTFDLGIILLKTLLRIRPAGIRL